MFKCRFDKKKYLKILSHLALHNMFLCNLKNKNFLLTSCWQSISIKYKSNTKLRHWKGTKKELFRFYWCHSGGSGYKVWKVRKKYVFTAGLVWYDHGDNNVWYKNLRKWKFHWQVDRRNYKHYDGVPSFLEWIRRNLFSLSNVGEFMMRVHHMMQVHHMMRVYHMYDGYSSYITYS